MSMLSEGLGNSIFSMGGGGTETRGGLTSSSTTSEGQAYGEDLYNKLGGMRFNKYRGPNPYGGSFTGDWSSALGNIGTEFAGPGGQWAGSRGVYKDVYGRGDPTALGGPGASSFLTGFGGKGVEDYKTAMGYDRSGLESSLMSDAGQAMKKAMIAENAKASSFGSRGQDVERGYDVRGEAYGGISSDVARQLAASDDAARREAMGYMGQDIGRQDYRTQQDINNKRQQDMLAMQAAQRAADPSNELAYASALGGLGKYEQGLDIAGKNWLQGLHDKEQAWDPMIASMQGNVVAQTPWATSTTGTSTETRPGQSDWEKMLGYGAIFGGSALGAMGDGGGGGGGMLS